MERFILHVDVNNAFLSWTAVERLKNGEKIDIFECYPKKTANSSQPKHRSLLDRFFG